MKPAMTGTASGGPRVALITGVSSGIGEATARGLAADGYRVFGTVRSADTAVPEGVERVVLDVRDGASIDHAVNDIIARAGRIDVLVNNAGLSVLGALEETDVAQAQALFDVNFFGVVRVTHAVLPVMRRQRSGRIVFVSSVVGFLPAPFMGFYAASKHALEGYGESLDHEIREFGIRCVLVEPGFMKTKIDQNAGQAANNIQDYAEARRRVGETIALRISAGEDPSVVAQVIREAAAARSPKLRYPVGKGSGMLRLLRKLMPEPLFARSLRSEFHVSGPA